MSTNTAIAEANRAVAEALGAEYDRRNFRIMRFGRHREGYLHAQVCINSQPPVYVSCQFGSWMIPKEPQSPGCLVVFHDRATLKDVLSPYKEALSETARRFETAERRKRADMAQSTVERLKDPREAVKLLTTLEYPEGEIVDTIANHYNMTPASARTLLKSAQEPIDAQ